MALLIKDPLTLLRALFLMRFVKRTANALDAGCGMGGLTLLLATRAQAVVGVSANKSDIAVATSRAQRFGFRNVKFIVYDLRDLAQGEGFLGLFDTIILFEVIEHILDDKSLVKALHSHLHPGGRLLITSPHLGTKLFPGERISKVEDGGHVRWGYSTDDIAKLCSQAGLQVESIETFAGPITYMLGYIMRILDRNLLTRALGQVIAFMLRPLQLLDPTIIRLTSYVPYEVGVVARKPTEASA